MKINHIQSNGHTVITKNVPVQIMFKHAGWNIFLLPHWQIQLFMKTHTEYFSSIYSEHSIFFQLVIQINLCIYSCIYIYRERVLFQIYTSLFKNQTSWFYPQPIVKKGVSELGLGSILLNWHHKSIMKGTKLQKCGNLFCIQNFIGLLLNQTGVWNFSSTKVEH